MFFCMQNNPTTELKKTIQRRDSVRDKFGCQGKSLSIRISYARHALDSPTFRLNAKMLQGL